MKFGNYCAIEVKDFFIHICVIDKNKNTEFMDFEFSTSGVNEFINYMVKCQNIQFIIYSIEYYKIYSFLFDLKQRLFLDKDNETLICVNNKLIYKYLHDDSVDKAYILAMLGYINYIGTCNFVRDYKYLVGNVPQIYTDFKRNFARFITSNGNNRGNSEDNNEEKFVKALNKIDINTSFKYPLVKVDTFGLCVTAEIVENLPHWIGLKHATNFQSILGVMTPPLNIKENNIVKTFSKQSKLNIIQYFNKKPFEESCKDPAEYLIVDLLMEKRSFLFLNQNKKYVAYTWDLSFVEFADFKCKVVDTIDISIEVFYNHIDKFVERILTCYKEENIIINCVKESEHLIELEYLKEIVDTKPELTKRVELYYQYLRKKIPKALFLDNIDNYAARTNLKLTVDPAHYQTEYFHDTVGEIVSYIKNRRQSSCQQ